MSVTVTRDRPEHLEWYLTPDEGVAVCPVVTWGDRVLYALQSKQLEAWRATPLCPKPSWVHQPTHVGFGGSAGGGKSYLARAVAVGTALQWPNASVLILRETKDAVHDNHVTPFREEVPGSLYDWHGGRMEATFYNGSTLRFGHLRTKADLRRYQGQAYDLIIPEEGTQLDPKLVNWLLNNRLRASAKGTTPFALIPTNPGGLGHADFKRKFVDRRHKPGIEDPADYVFIQAYLRDNLILVRRDPGYVRQLNQLPSPWREWLKDGDFEAGAGAAFPMLDRGRHLVDPFPVPAHWPMWGGFDWGYDHPWAFGIYVSNEDGRAFKLDTFHGRREAPRAIVTAIRELADVRNIDINRLSYVSSDHLIFSKRGRDVGYDGPTIADQFVEWGIPVVRASNERIRGRQALAQWLSWDDDEDLLPGLRFFTTPGNLICYDQLETRVPDPDRIEDVLKTDADEFGEGGDDDYDETRYAVASRPGKAESLAAARQIRAWDTDTLKVEAERTRRGRGRAPGEVHQLDRTELPGELAGLL